MKKNKMMRLASGLLVAVLITTSTISGTYAKYVTSDSAEDYARVAKWGVRVTADGTLFEKEYDKDDNTYTVGDETVVSSNEWKLVAPGTTKTNTEVVITGTPEVATRVTYEATIELVNWKLENDDEYCPLIFTVEGTDYMIDHAANETVAAFAARVEEAIENCKADYAPNIPLESHSTDFPSVTWTWEFEGEKVGAKLAGYQTDVKDTELGNLAVSRDTFVRVEIATTVTQID
ncbi:MAG: hypothetical protein IJO54_02645 [Oscillospiraceae bacterium]|nr:hypothetical protein [Oscillospiraceae bacterium]